MLSRFVELVTGDDQTPERRPGAREVPMLANFLGYRAYNPSEQIFHLTRSKGFILELAPLIGADERISDILNSIFSDVLLPGCEFQIINYASPRIAEKLQEWALPRVRAGQVFDKLARYRLALLRNGAWTTLPCGEVRAGIARACRIPVPPARAAAPIPAASRQSLATHN